MGKLFKRNLSNKFDYDYLENLGKIKGCLLLDIPIKSAISDNDYQHDYYSNLLLSRNELFVSNANNFLVLDKDADWYIQYYSMNSMSYDNLVFQNLNLQYNSSLLTQGIISEFRNKLNSNQDVMGLDVMSIKWIPQSRNVYNQKFLSEFVAVPSNNENLDKIVYPQGNLYKQNKHTNSRENVVENFKNPLGSFNNIVKFENDGSFENQTFNTSSFSKIVELVENYTTPIINRLSTFLTDLEFSIKANRSMDVMSILASNIDNINFNSTNGSESCGREFSINFPYNNNNVKLVPADIYCLKNLYGNPGILVENLKNILILRILNSLPPYSLIPLKLENLKKLNYQPNTKLYCKTDTSEDYLSFCGNPSKLTIDNILTMVDFVNNPKPNDDAIETVKIGSDDVDKSLFDRAIKFIKTQS